MWRNAAAAGGGRAAGRWELAGRVASAATPRRREHDGFGQGRFDPGHRRIDRGDRRHAETAIGRHRVGLGRRHVGHVLGRRGRRFGGRWLFLDVEGLQILGRPFDEATVLKVAGVVENAADFTAVPPFVSARI